jgi:hypothetical protein
MKATRIVSDSGGLPAHHIDAFLDRLRAAHYSEVSLRKKRRILCAFSGWMRNRNIDLIVLDESVTARFMKRLIDTSRDRVQRARPTLRQFLAYLRAEAIVCPPTLDRQSAMAHIYGRYLDYLRQDRGLAKNSLLVYGPFIRDFLDSHSAGDGSLLPDAFYAVTIRNHLLARSKGRSPEYTRLMAVALISYFCAAIRHKICVSPCPQFVSGDSQLYRRSSRLSSKKLSLHLQTGRLRLGAVTTQSCCCWRGSVYVLEKSSQSSLTTFTGVRGSSSFMARGRWSSTSRCHRRSEKQSQHISAMVAERVRRGAYSFADWHLGLGWRGRRRLARLFVRPSHVPVSAPRAGAPHICSVTASRRR